MIKDLGQWLHGKVHKRISRNPKINASNIFIITSHGQTATRWLSSVLNKHPDIFSSHGYTYPPTHTENRDLSQEEIEKILSLSNKRFWEITLSQYISELKEVKSKSYIGSVHAYMYGYLMNQLKDPSIAHARKQLVIINMVRHPISRIQSAFKCWLPDHLENVESSFVDNDFNNRCRFITSSIKNIKTDYSISDKYFTVALLQACDIARDIALATKNKCPQIRFEDITTKPDSIKSIIKLISQGKIKLSPEEAQNLLQTDRINEHNKGNHPKQPDHIFSTWEEWKQRAYLHIHQSQNFDSVYSSFGYDFSFL